MKRLVSLLCSFTVIVGEEEEEKNSNDVVCSQAHNTRRETRAIKVLLLFRCVYALAELRNYRHFTFRSIRVLARSPSSKALLLIRAVNYNSNISSSSSIWMSFKLFIVNGCRIYAVNEFQASIGLVFF